MTYCLGMLLDEGLIMMADTRTNAGIDDFSCYRKLTCLLDEKESCIYVASAGNLSISQTAISMIREGLPDDDTNRTLAGAPTMFRAAQLVGEALHTANHAVADSIDAGHSAVGATFLMGGRMANGPPKLYLIYEAGNFIECQREVPFFQIGETKYGRPILDRVIRSSTPLAEAVKIGFLSFDSCMRSNLGVARPIDIMVMPRNPAEPVLTRRIENDDAYFNDLSTRWSTLLHTATRTIPDPPFMTGGE